MNTVDFSTWLARVLEHGESVQPAATVIKSVDRVLSRPQLQSAFYVYCMDVAGPVLPFAEDAAWQAAVTLAEACWKLVGDDADAPQPALHIANPTAADHVAVDLTLRFLPNVERRARLRTDRSKLTESLQAMLRQWPLSGVLGQVTSAPTGDTGFAGHAGLQLLYAERLIRNGQPTWLPNDPTAMLWCERVYHERGQPMPCPVVHPGVDA